MATISVPAGLDLAPPTAAAGSLAVEIAETLGSAEAAWRQLEREGASSPYCRYDWVAAFASGEPSVRIAVVSDRSGRPVLVLPLTVERRLGACVGTGIGGKHVNFTVPLTRPDIWASLTEADAGTVLREIGRKLRLDAFAFINVPVEWGGRPNPFAAGGRPSPSDAWGLPLEADPDATLARSMSSDARKKLRAKLRNIAKLGTVELRQARDAADVELMLAAFLRQKEERFRDLGIPDPFAGEEMGDILRRGALAALDEGRPAIELYGLTIDGRVVALLGGAADDERLSGMFVSYEQGEATKFSPGEILATEIIRLQCARGRKSFDLGVGDARYKRTMCDRREALVDVVVPITPVGHLYRASRGAFIELKRRVKASPRAMAAVGAVRRTLRGA